MKRQDTEWKSFNFDETHNKTSKKKRKLLDHVVNDVLPDGSLKGASCNFFSAITPSTVEDLAVNSKKIESVKIWLQTNKHKPSILLLSGPTGTGKTVAFRVLCKSMNLRIIEWINPVDHEFDLVGQTNEVTRFIENISVDSNYPSLLGDPQAKNISLVEDFPTTFLKNPQEFHDVLEQFVYISNHPLVFICSDVTINKKNMVHHLFPEEVLSKYGITHITFNSCAMTHLKKALRRAKELIMQYPDTFEIPSSKVEQAILLSSMGDLRCAMNQYYFSSLIGTAKAPKNFDIQKLMNKNETLGLFHALGRILNPKWHETKLDCDVDALIKELETQPQNTIAFLFENYPKYFGNLTDVQEASNILSYSQGFLQRWSEGVDLQEYSMWSSVLGLMVTNRHPAKKWNQIKGPKKIGSKTNRNSSMDQYYINRILAARK